MIVALDVDDADRAEALAEALSGAAGMVKVGLQLFVAAGPDAVRRVREHGAVFLDLKLHDIPTTVERAARAAGRLGVDLLTVHALGGPDMVAAAVRGGGEGAAEAGHPPPRVLGVTVLSSLGGESLASPASLAFEAVAAGASGAVVSGEDVGSVREAVGRDAVLVVPGIRPAGHEANDHVRVLTPREAVEAGADYLVVGRPVTAAPDPGAAARAVLAQLR
ncbi:MAG: orotidine-5'-phosphate decarboxylase [Actinobacteria bacterium]|nr:orotidine-5'-phosphate decarboxylase [Actinomycetota bacterium]